MIPRSPLARRLVGFPNVGDGDLAALESLMPVPELFQPGAEIVPEGQPPRATFVVVGGMACRQRELSDGGRQITSFLVPGDVFCVDAFVGQPMDHSVHAVVQTRIAALDRGAVPRLLSERPALAAALWWATLQGEAVMRDHLVALGRRDARGRVAYLLCELGARHEAVGLSCGRLCITQSRIADALGLTPVHVNRVLKQMQKDDLVRIERGAVTIRDPATLDAIAEYDRARRVAPAPGCANGHAWAGPQATHHEDAILRPVFAQSPRD